MPKKRKRTERPRSRKPSEVIKVSLSEIDYKNPEILRKFMSSRFKILPQSISGLSAKKQRKLRDEIKKSRIMGLLPFTDRHALG
jgi:small subunit ribosomal protein S18